MKCQCTRTTCSIDGFYSVLISLSLAACHSLASLTAALMLSVWQCLLADPSLKVVALWLVLLALHRPNSDTQVSRRRSPPLPAVTHKAPHPNRAMAEDKASTDELEGQQTMPPHLNVSNLHAQTLGVVPAHAMPHEQAEVTSLGTRSEGGRPTLQNKPWH